MVVVAFGLVSMRKRRRWTVTRSVLVHSRHAADRGPALAFGETGSAGICTDRVVVVLAASAHLNSIREADDAMTRVLITRGGPARRVP
jgi:hypothetical protein